MVDKDTLSTSQPKKPSSSPPKPDPSLQSIEQRAPKRVHGKPQRRNPHKPKPDPNLRSTQGKMGVFRGADRRLKSVESRVTVAPKPVRRTEKGRKSSK